MTDRVKMGPGNDIGFLIETHTCHVEYQPIIETKTGRAYAYEALARFEVKGEDIPPDRIFSLCKKQKDVLFQLEMIVKKTQLDNRPKDKKLFLNISPHSLTNRACRYAWAEFFEYQENIVVEITEHTTSQNTDDIESFVYLLKNNKTKYALDDLFQGKALFSTDLFINAPVIKLDKMFLEYTRDHPCYIEFLRGIVNFCNKKGKILVLEGVETEEDLNLAKKLDIGYVQGFYYKDQFIKA